MAKTTLLAVTTDAYTDIVVQSVCTKIVLLEDGGGASTKTIFRGGSGDDDLTYGQGVGVEIPTRSRPYQPGEVVGQIKAADANANYGQLEV